jgi:hypothetical protein
MSRVQTRVAFRGVHHDHILKANGGHQAVLRKDEGVPAVDIQGPAQDDVSPVIRGEQIVEGAPGAYIAPAQELYINIGIHNFIIFNKLKIDIQGAGRDALVNRFGERLS